MTFEMTLCETRNDLKCLLNLGLSDVRAPALRLFLRADLIPTVWYRCSLVFVICFHNVLFLQHSLGITYDLPCRFCAVGFEKWAYSILALPVLHFRQSIGAPQRVSVATRRSGLADRNDTTVLRRVNLLRSASPVAVISRGEPSSDRRARPLTSRASSSSRLVNSRSRRNGHAVNFLRFPGGSRRNFD